MDLLISVFVILTLIGYAPIFWAMLRSFSSIESDKKYLDMPSSSVLQELRQSVCDRLRTMPNTSLGHDINFHEISYDSFREILLFHKTPVREAVLSAREDPSQITAVARFPRDPIDEIDVNKYLLVVMANGDTYEITAKSTSQDEIIFIRNEAMIGQLTKKPTMARGLSKLFDYDVWDIYIAGQYWGELKNTGKVVTWSSYKIFNQEFPDGLPVKISEEEDSHLRTLRKCLLLVSMFFTLWTLWPYWFNMTSWSKSKWFSTVNEDTVLLSNKHDLSPEQIEIYFLVSMLLRLVVFGRDYRMAGG